MKRSQIYKMHKAIATNWTKYSKWRQIFEWGARRRVVVIAYRLFIIVVVYSVWCARQPNSFCAFLSERSRLLLGWTLFLLLMLLSLFLFRFWFFMESSVVCVCALFFVMFSVRVVVVLIFSHRCYFSQRFFFVVLFLCCWRQHCRLHPLALVPSKFLPANFA